MKPWIFLVILVSVMLILRDSRSTEGCEIYPPRDCQDFKDLNFTESGVYNVTPVGTYNGFEVYCDMDTDGGGWLVFQRRIDGSEDFYRDWESYQIGFGNKSAEHWLGNLKLHMITYQGHYELRVDLEDWEGNLAFARYMYFGVTGPAKMYRVTVGGYFGTAGDAFNNMSSSYFTTKDRDNDSKDNFNCAREFKGAWWYNACHDANLNGVYLSGNHTSYANGVNWLPWTGSYYSLKRTEMKIRRVHMQKVSTDSLGKDYNAP